MQLLDLPTNGILLLNSVGGRIMRWLIGKHPVNVAMCGNYLE